jgi:hypothetical protein
MFLGSKVRRVRRADNLTAICEAWLGLQQNFRHNNTSELNNYRMMIGRSKS